MRVGILTGGGDCPGLNAVVRAATKSLMLEYNAEIVGVEDGFLGLIERRTRPLSYKDVSGILAQGGTILGTNNRANPFKFYGRGGADVSDEVMAYYHELGLDALVALGGDGTMSMCHELEQKGMKIIGVPKTIDNDLRATDRTFGFDTAVAIATDAVDRLQTTGQSHGRVMILETMGRYAGWLALYSGVAGGADIILIPEIPYQIEDVVKTCQQRSGRQRFTVIVVAEGAMPQGGSMSIAQVDPSSPDPIRLGGIGNALRQAIEQRAPELEVRTTVLGHIQRGGSPTPFDRLLATQFGTYAASLVASGQFGRMVALQDNRLTSVPLAQVANKTRTVPRDCLMVASALAVGTSFGDPTLRIPLDGLGDGILAQ
jgi:ATP-dependent phosphofructokinase / diphosphate-dependent phosphofructokinase